MCPVPEQLYAGNVGVVKMPVKKAQRGCVVLGHAVSHIGRCILLILQYLPNVAPGGPGVGAGHQVKRKDRDDYCDPWGQQPGGIR